MARTAIHPGEHLAEELSALGMSAAELARQLGVPTNRITEILNGRRAITGDTALRLAHFFGTSAEFWLNLQSLYDIRLGAEIGEVHPCLAQAEEIRTSSRLVRHALIFSGLCGFDREFQSHGFGHGDQSGQTRISANR